MIEELITFILIIGIIFLVVNTNINLKEQEEYQRKYDGLRLGGKDYFEVVNKTKEYDRLGDWVCVNVRDMDYKRALEVCSHEVGHEIFAEECEKDINKCLNAVGK